MIGGQCNGRDAESTKNIFSVGDISKRDFRVRTTGDVGEETGGEVIKRGYTISKVIKAWWTERI